MAIPAPRTFPLRLKPLIESEQLFTDINATTWMDWLEIAIPIKL
jgi:hypothetical protein